jgi:putative transcriptional regulator
MTKRAFDKIAAGLNDAIAYANGDTSRARVHEPVDVRAIRQANGMTQEAFARTYGFTIGALRDWEQGRKQPERTARILLGVIAENPAAVARAAARI